MSKIKKEFVRIFGGIYFPVSRFIHERWVLNFPEWYARFFHKRLTGKKLDLNNPRDFQEKIQWLKLYSDTSQWTDLADKYKVRDYVNQCGLGEILVKLYGVWERAEDIDFGRLPEKFVFKTNHGFRRVIVVEDKSKLDIDKTVKQLNAWVKERVGLVSFEPHYWNIERRIIAEEYLEDESRKDISSSLIDYKIFCFHGEPEIIRCLFGREYFGEDTIASIDEKKHSELKVQLFDMDWNLRLEYLSEATEPYTEKVLPKPDQLNEMKRVCRILGKPFPIVRIDLYEVNGKVYFGEMTFTPGGGNDHMFTKEYADELGKKIDLSSIKRRNKRSVI